MQLYFCPVDRAVLKFLNLRIKCKDSRHTLDRVLDCRRRNTVILIILGLIDLTIHISSDKYMNIEIHKNYTKDSLYAKRTQNITTNREESMTPNKIYRSKKSKKKKRNKERKTAKNIDTKCEKLHQTKCTACVSMLSGVVQGTNATHLGFLEVAYICTEQLEL